MPTYAAQRNSSVSAPSWTPIRFRLRFAAAYVHNLKTYYVIITIEKSEKFVGGGGGKTVVF